MFVEPLLSPFAPPLVTRINTSTPPHSAANNSKGNPDFEHLVPVPGHPLERCPSTTESKQQKLDFPRKAEPSPTPPSSPSSSSEHEPPKNSRRRAPSPAFPYYRSKSSAKRAVIPTQTSVNDPRNTSGEPSKTLGEHLLLPFLLIFRTLGVEEEAGVQ